MRVGDANFRGTYHMGYTEIIDPGASGEAGFSGLALKTCSRAKRTSNESKENI